MSPKLKSRWIKALTSGKYKQTQKCLKRIDKNGEPSYCCLGVLADLVDPLGWTEEGTTIDWHEQPDTFSDEYLDSMGLSCKSQNILIDMNDGGASFLKIANWIEEDLHD